MAKIPKIPEEIFPEITEQLKSTFSGDLQSVVLYGSGASGAYVPGKSDLNFLVVVTDEGLKNLRRLHDVVGKWHKRQVATPLVMTKSFLENALDVYPVEFLTMKEHHIQVFGDDCLSSLSFDRTCMRLQVEREIKGKLIHLRQGYLESEGQPKNFRDLIKVSLVAFLSLFTAILYLKGRPVPSERRQVINKACELAGIDSGIFIKCLDIKEEAIKYDLKEMASLFEKYLGEVEKFDHFVDQLKQEID
jgi:predicted nucleotidyltransferase